MRRARGVGAALVALVAMLAAGPLALGEGGAPGDPAAPADGSPAEVVAALREALADLQRVRDERVAARRAAEARLERLDEQIDRLERQRDTLRVERGRSAVEAEEAARAKAAREAEEAGLRAEVDAALASLGSTARAAAALTPGSGLTRDDLGGGFEGLADAIAGRAGEGAASAATRLDAAKALLERLVTALRAGRTRTVKSEPVPVDADHVRHAYVVRLGLVIAGYVTEDGRSVGLARPGEPAWRPVPDGSSRGAIAEVVRILQRQRPPAIVPVPIPPPAEGPGR